MNPSEFIPNPLIIPVGFAVGVLIAAPVGPVNIICIQRAIAKGAFGGMAAGLGAVLGDGLIALAAALGVGLISGAITQYQTAIQLIGGIAIMVFGVKLYATEPVIEQAPNGDEQRWATLVELIWDVPKTFFLTVTNPAAVLGLIAIFGGVSSFVEVRSRVDAFTMVAAIMIGSMAWWVFLSVLIGRLRGRLTLRSVGRINKVAGLLMIGFGVLLAGELVVKAMR
jgi:threonine/homoserine/homoserine lactone efflux protein